MSILFFLGLSSIWYEFDVYPFLLTTSNVKESTRIFLHNVVLFGVPIIGIGVGLLVSLYLTHRFPKGVEESRRSLNTMSIIPLILALIFYASQLLFSFPERIGVYAYVNSYKITFAQRYRYDPFPENVLFIEVTRADGEGIRQTLVERWEPRDGTTTICKELSTRRLEEKLYFMCDNESVSLNTPYINYDTKSIYIGRGKCSSEITLDELFATWRFSICDN